MKKLSNPVHDVRRSPTQQQATTTQSKNKQQTYSPIDCMYIAISIVDLDFMINLDLFCSLAKILRPAMFAINSLRRHLD